MEHPPEVPAIHLKLTLEEVEIPVWRELVVPGQWDLGTVHHVIQVAMGWENCHLHKFTGGKRTWGTPQGVDYDPPVLEETETTLHEVLTRPRAVLRYTYDFGDWWEHKLTAIALLAPAVSATCLGGGGACPPEDSGGASRYEYLLEVLANPTHPEYTDRIDWVGGSFDPNRFEMSRVGFALTLINP